MATSPNLDAVQLLLGNEQSEAKFYQRLSTSMQHVLTYEDPEAQHKALSHIPLSLLNTNVQKTMESLGKQDDVHPKDLLLLELLAWFKRDFFKWMNSPKCLGCGGVTHSAGSATPRPEELRYGANRVENYLCNTCSTYTRFPRYNNPVKLLETRSGRCGEWANCFTLCCRAVGFEARYVLDWTDHVWTEVYSEKQQRWLHCDPCENSCDKPLVYEAGWNKKLSYIIAFSKDDIQDVTWRYSTKHQEVLTRRRECRESWLVSLITKLCKERQKSLASERQLELKQRLLTELIEFLSTKSAGDEERVGRSSGSVAWRVARGEVGSTSTASSGCIITPSKTELSTRQILLKYCCALDSYTRGDGSQVLGWHSMVHFMENMMRKEERDWEMVYLARTEGSQTATITWKIDLTGSGMVVDTVDLQVLSCTYESGRIAWRVCGDDTCTILPADGKMTHIINLMGSSTLTLTASLSEGRGDIAWQHTQLFRQKSTDTDSPLLIKLSLKPT